jgi:hypothetical protein
MSEENVELSLRLVDTYNRRDVDAAARSTRSTRTGSFG